MRPSAKATEPLVTRRLSESRSFHNTSAEGLKWLGRAGIVGDREAQVALVGRYRGGPDATADPIEQLCWLIVIASEEPTASQEALLRGQMKPANVVEARRRAAIISAKPKSNYLCSRATRHTVQP
jgi:hypothetical protein